jgi:4-amino-4-deoxy-L-arabinose transferase-like glycosyltransferase
MDVDPTMVVDVTQALPVETASPDFKVERSRAVTAFGLIMLAFTLWLAFEIPRGTLAQTDELLTAERTREMLMTEPWVVRYNFNLSFEKPPLQYWLTCLTLPRFENRSTAVRIWPLAYATLTATALGWLAFLVQPARPRLIPVAAAILVASPLFSTEACRAMLDIGLTFFTTLTIVFAELARKRPAWWLAVAVACWLGSLQKIPLPFLIWLLIVIVRLTDPSERVRLRRGTAWVTGGMVLALALMAVWPLLQLIKYHMPVGDLLNEEVVVWLGPEFLGKRTYFHVLLALPFVGGLGGLFLLLAPLVTLFSRKKRPTAAVREIAIVCLLVIALTIVSNFRSVRYLLPILPCLSLLVGLIFCQFLEQGSKIRTRTVAVLAIILFAGFLQAELQVILRKKDVAEEKVVAEKLGEMQRPGTKIVLIKAIQAGNDLMWDAFYLFHGNFRFPVARYTVDEIRNDPPKPPLIGACVARDFPIVREVYPNVQVELVQAQFMCWQVSTAGSATPP